MAEVPGKPIVHTQSYRHSDTYTIAATGETVDATPSGFRSFGIQVKGTGAAATAWSIVLEVSLDGTNFATLLEHDSSAGDSDGGIVWSGAADSPSLYFRSRLISVTLGSASSIRVTIAGFN